MTTMGWLGTGRMGSAMGLRLIAAGHPLSVWNRTLSKTDELATAGATVVQKLGELGACDVVFVMVSTPRDLEEVVLGPGGLLAGARVTPTIVDCSTIDEPTSARVRTAAEARGVRFLAAPICGNPEVVAAGDAVIVASGPRTTYEELADVLSEIARPVYVGERDEARIIKICHNLYLGLIVQSLAEVTTLAEKSGVRRDAFLDFMNCTVLASEWARRRSPALLNLDWTPTFTTDLLRKDVDLGLAAAHAAEVPMPLSAAVQQLLLSAVARGFRDDDYLAMFQRQAESAGLTLEPARNP